MPDSHQKAAIVVDILAFRLRDYDKDFEIGVTMNVVVGKAYGGHNTTVFGNKHDPVGGASEQRELSNLLPSVRATRSKQFQLFPYLAQVDWFRNIGIKTGRDRSFPIPQHRAGRHGNHR